MKIETDITGFCIDEGRPADREGMRMIIKQYPGLRAVVGFSAEFDTIWIGTNKKYKHFDCRMALESRFSCRANGDKTWAVCKTHSIDLDKAKLFWVDVELCFQEIDKLENFAKLHLLYEFEQELSKDLPNLMEEKEDGTRSSDV